jgi:tRNA(Arg) A34 adenosine deaminase TadA
MAYALKLAKSAGQVGEVPVAAIITDANGQIIAEAANAMHQLSCATAHAEMRVIEQAMQKTGLARLPAYDIWVTLEPCAMCAGAISHARLRRLYFGAYDPKGAVEHGPCLFSQKTTHHQPEIIGGIQQTACADLLKQFFAERR